MEVLIPYRKIRDGQLTKYVKTNAEPDIFLRCENKTYLVHQAFIGQKSEKLNDRLRGSLDTQENLRCMELNTIKPRFLETLLDFIYGDAYILPNTSSTNNLYKAGFHGQMYVIGHEWMVKGLPRLALRYFDHEIGELVDSGTFASSRRPGRFMSHIYASTRGYPMDLRTHLMAFVRRDLKALMDNEEFVGQCERIEGFTTDIIAMMLQPEKVVHCPRCDALETHREMSMKCTICSKVKRPE